MIAEGWLVTGGRNRPIAYVTVAKTRSSVQAVQHHRRVLSDLLLTGGRTVERQMGDYTVVSSSVKRRRFWH